MSSHISSLYRSSGVDDLVRFSLSGLYSSCPLLDVITVYIEALRPAVELVFPVLLYFGNTVCFEVEKHHSFTESSSPRGSFSRKGREILFGFKSGAIDRENHYRCGREKKKFTGYRTFPFLSNVAAD